MGKHTHAAAMALGMCLTGRSFGCSIRPSVASRQALAWTDTGASFRFRARNRFLQEIFLPIGEDAKRVKPERPARGGIGERPWTPPAYDTAESPLSRQQQTVANFLLAAAAHIAMIRASLLLGGAILEGLCTFTRALARRRKAPPPSRRQRESSSVGRPRVGGARVQLPFALFHPLVPSDPCARARWRAEGRISLMFLRPTPERKGPRVVSAPRARSAAQKPRGLLRPARSSTRAVASGVGAAARAGTGGGTERSSTVVQRRRWGSGPSKPPRRLGTATVGTAVVSGSYKGTGGDWRGHNAAPTPDCALHQRRQQPPPQASEPGWGLVGGEGEAMAALAHGLRQDGEEEEET